MVKPTFSGECEYPSLGRFVTLLGSCWCAPPVWDPRESELVPELTVGPRAPSAPPPRYSAAIPNWEPFQIGRTLNYKIAVGVRLPLSPSFEFEVDDISVHFRKQN